VDAAERLRSLNAALALLEDGRHGRSERICRCLVKHDRDDVEASLVLGLAVGMQGRTAAAAALFNRVAQARPGFAHPCADLARMLLAHDNMSLVAPQYRACLRLAPDDLRLHYAFAGFLRETGEAAEAVSMLAPVLRAHPDSAEAHDQMGLALAEAGRFADAIGQFRQSIASDPAQATFWANLGMMLKVEGQLDAALDAYDAALTRAPGDRQIRVNRAVARLHAGRFAEAWQDED
jgi:Flp pilus assembly protein TadD